MKKKIKKVCTNKNNAYLCNRNQKKSSLKYNKWVANWQPF